MKTNIVTKAIEKLGLSKFEASLYAKLLETKQPTVAQLARVLNVQRPKVYEGLKKLQQKGLLEQEKNYSRKIDLESPAKVLALLRHEENETKRIAQNLSQVLPDLLSKYHSSSRQPQVKVYEGRDQFINIYDQILEEVKDEFLFLGSGEKLVELIGVEYEREWIRRRIAKDIHIRVLSYPSEAISRLRGEDKKALRELKWLPKEFISDASFHIFGAKLVHWNPILPKAIVIEDKVISDLFRNIFEMLWRISQ